jgi:DNA modification methylase
VTRYLRTEMVPLDELTPFPGNARRGKVDVIKESIEKNGQYRSLVVREIKNGPLIVLAGNHTMAAIKELDGAKARCEIIDCDDETARRINLVDNRANDLAEDDDEALAALMRDLTEGAAGTGYTDDEVASYLDDLNSVIDGGEKIPGDIQIDEPVPEAPERIVTRKGDVWTLGSHRLMCGDCRNPGDVLALLDGSPVNLAFTSPPYASQRDYDEESGFKPIPPDEYVEWFAPVADNVRAHLADGGSWFVNIKASCDGLDTYLYVMDLVIAHAREWGWHYVTELCWRRIGVPKSVTRRFKNQFEPIYQFARGEFTMHPDRVRHESDNVPENVGPGGGNTSWRDAQGNGMAGAISDKANKARRKAQGPGAGPTMSGQQGQRGDSSVTRPSKATRDMMSDRQGSGGAYGPTGGVHGATLGGLAYPGNMLPTFSQDHTATGHTAAFPVGLPQWFVLVYSNPGDVVYDPFCGSGSTLLACEREGRHGYGMEISPKYCDLTAKRFQDVTSTVPLLNGKPHDFTA